MADKRSDHCVVKWADGSRSEPLDSPIVARDLVLDRFPEAVFSDTFGNLPLAVVFRDRAAADACDWALDGDSVASIWRHPLGL